MQVRFRIYFERSSKYFHHILIIYFSNIFKSKYTVWKSSCCHIVYFLYSSTVRWIIKKLTGTTKYKKNVIKYNDIWWFIWSEWWYKYNEINDYHNKLTKRKYKAIGRQKICIIVVTKINVKVFKIIL